MEVRVEVQRRLPNVLVLCDVVVVVGGGVVLFFWQKVVVLIRMWLSQVVGDLAAHFVVIVVESVRGDAVLAGPVARIVLQQLVVLPQQLEQLHRSPLG